AIAFQGAWAREFDAGATRDQAFRLADGSTVTVPTMHKQDNPAIAVLPGDNAIIGLPFKGNDLSLILVVPGAPGGLPALEAQLSASAIAQWVASLQPGPRSVDFSLPKSTTKHGFALEATLGKLGIVGAFAPLTADLSGVDGRRDLFVGAAL